MSLTQVQLERILIPVHSMYGSGEVADHTVKEDHLRKDAHNRAEVAYVEVRRGDILYTKAADFNKLSDVEKEYAYFVFDDSSIKRYDKLDAVKDYKPQAAKEEEAETADESSDGSGGENKKSK